MLTADEKAAVEAILTQAVPGDATYPGKLKTVRSSRTPPRQQLLELLGAEKLMELVRLATLDTWVE